MSMLFELSSEDIFASNPQLKAYGEFRDLSHEEMSYIVAVYDHASILHRMPFKARQDKALKEYGYFKKGEYTKAAEELRSPQGKIKKAIEFLQDLLGFNPYSLIEGTEKLLVDANEIMKNGVLPGAEEEDEVMDIMDRMKVGKDVASILKGRKEIMDVINPPDKEADNLEAKREGQSIADELGAKSLEG